jgi:hypothetical protein
MHSEARGHSREDIVQQSRDRENNSLTEWKKYISIGKSVSKLTRWKQNGAKLMYLTSRTKDHEIEEIREALTKNCFPEGLLISRKEGKSFRNVIEIHKPDVLIEDDCESIGGKKEMVYTSLELGLQKKIVLIGVKEFGGVDHLPDNLSDLISL